MRLVYITLARKILCYGSFPAKVLLGTNAYNFLLLLAYLYGFCGLGVFSKEKSFAVA